MQKLDSYAVSNNELMNKKVIVPSYAKVYDLYYREFPELLKDKKFKTDFKHSDVVGKEGTVVGLFKHKSKPDIILALVEYKNFNNELFRVFINSSALSKV